MSKSNKEFWVRNISNKNIGLTDLAYTIPANTSKNLLSKHFSYNINTLLKSSKEGSLYQKKDKVILCSGPPKGEAYSPFELSTQVIQKPLRSAVKISTQEFEDDWIISDEKFAEMMTEDDK